jgi:apolipoprotein N-acyltransferase
MTTNPTMETGIRPIATAILCAMASAVCFYLSFNHGDVWPLAWLAPIPVLWFAFGETRPWIAFASSWAAYALGYCNILPAYAGILPISVLAAALTLPALAFASSVRGAQLVARRVSPMAGALAFASLWTAWDYVVSFGSWGTATSPAYSQVGATVLIQGALVFGIWIITFLLGIVPAGIAMSLRRKTITPAAVAAVLFAVNVGFGSWRILGASEPKPVRVGLAVDDPIGRASFVANADTALGAVREYSAAARALVAQGARLIVLPEKLAVLQSGWRSEAVSELEAVTRGSDATIVIGFDERDAVRRNEALIFAADGAPLSAYFKRHLVEGLEFAFAPGRSPLVLSDRIGVAICKDMDFPRTLRSDAMKGNLAIVAVPAWDFDGDAWWHARLAIMRGVEDGFAVARAAKQGLLSLSDAYGRVIAVKRSTKDGMVMVAADLSPGAGDTLYLRLGDLLAWVSVAGSILVRTMALRG